MMKRNLLNVVMAVCGVLLLTACPKDSEPEISLTVSPTSVTLDRFNKATITIKSNGKWSISADSWLSLSYYSGSGDQTINIEAGPYNRIRSGSMVIEDETKKYKIVVSVIQNSSTPTNDPTPTTGEQPEVSKTSMSFAADGGEDSFELTTTTNWTSSCDVNWIFVNPSSGYSGRTVKVRADANPNADARSGKIMVTTGGTTFTIGVSQEGKSSGPAYYVNVSTVSLSFANSGGTDSFTIDSNDECSVKQTSNTSSWLTVTPSGNTVTVTANANETTTSREATITVTGKASGISKEVKVTQEAVSYTLNVPTDKLSFTSGSSSQTVKVSGNDSWTASSNQSWCRVPSSGSSDITVTVDPNNKPDERVALITIKGDYTGNTFNIEVRQSGAAYEFGISGSTSLQFDASAYSKTVTVTGNDSWTATSTESWCVVSPTYGQGSSSVSVSVKLNTSTSDRYAKLYFHGKNTNKDVTVSVTQYGADATLSATMNKTTFASSANDEATLTVTSNESWTVSLSGGDWLSFSKSSGSGNQSVTVRTTKANSTGSQRSAVVVIRTTSGKEKTIEVTQKADNNIDKTDFDSEKQL